jgi:hypothetical protein
VHKNRWAVSVAALALTSLALTSCGGDDADSSDAESAELEVLSAEQAEQALLSETVMGADFAAGEPSEDSDEGAPGCLSALDDLDDIGAETKTEVEYTSTSDIGLPSVEHSVFSYTEVDPISARIEEVSTALDGCTTVEETDEEGTEYALDVTLSTETTTDAADEQVNLEAVGTITSGDQEFPLGVYMSSVRVENHVSVVVFTDIPEDEAASSEAFDAYVTAAADRLAAVAAGEEPAEEPIAPPAT